MSDARGIMVWPLPLRVIHWLLAICVLVAWFTPNIYEMPHRWAGYGALVLVGVRIVCGVVGPPHVRFVHMVRTASGALCYMRRPKKKSAGAARLGLNPIGAIMALTLLVLLVVCGATGWMQVTEPYFGVAWVQDTHTYTSYALAGLIPLHVLGVLVTSTMQRENLVRAMITGRRPIK